MLATRLRGWICRGMIGACATTMALIPAPARAAEPPSTQSSLVWHEGRWLVDASGRVVMLHGFNVVAKLPPYTAQSMGFGRDDAAFLEAHGFNVVRLGVMWSAVEPEPGRYDEQYLDRIASTVRDLADHDIYTLIDFHQDSYHESVGGQGFPDWAVDTRAAGVAPIPHLPLPLVPPDQYVAWDNFWANVDAPDGVPLWDRFAKFWQHVATRFKGDSWVIGYDLMNEPVGGTQSPLCLNTVACPFDATLSRFYTQVIPQIRAVDPHHLIWYEPNIFAGAGGAMNIDHGGDPGAVLSFHNYCALTALSAGNVPAELRDPLCPVTEDIDFGNAERQATRNGDGLVMTEFGSVPHAAELVRVAAAADARMLGWTEWTYHNTGHTNFAGEYSLVKDPSEPPRGSNVDTRLLQILARPYPRMIAGTPKSWVFDPATRTFSLTYSSRRVGRNSQFPVGSHTIVAIPEVQYPRGYRVVVTGGRVVSKADASMLHIASASRGTVTVKIVPRG